MQGSWKLVLQNGFGVQRGSGQDRAREEGGGRRKIEEGEETERQFIFVWYWILNCLYYVYTKTLFSCYLTMFGKLTG